MNQYPYSAIGILKSTFFRSTVHGNEYKTAFGTAFLISPKLLMTAAHNIYDLELEYCIEKIEFYPSDKTKNIN